LTYRCRTCGRDNRLPNQCGCEPRHNVRTDYLPVDHLHDRGTDRLLAAIDRHQAASERVTDALEDLERIEREHQVYLRQTQSEVQRLRLDLIKVLDFSAEVRP